MSENPIVIFLDNLRNSKNNDIEVKLHNFSNLAIPAINYLIENENDYPDFLFYNIVIFAFREIKNNKKLNILSYKLIDFLDSKHHQYTARMISEIIKFQSKNDPRFYHQKLAKIIVNDTIVSKNTTIIHDAFNELCQMQSRFKKDFFNEVIRHDAIDFIIKSIDDFYLTFNHKDMFDLFLSGKINITKLNSLTFSLNNSKLTFTHKDFFEYIFDNIDKFDDSNIASFTKIISFKIWKSYDEYNKNIFKKLYKASFNHYEIVNKIINADGAIKRDYHQYIEKNKNSIFFKIGNSFHEFFNKKPEMSFETGFEIFNNMI